MRESVTSRRSSADAPSPPGPSLALLCPSTVDCSVLICISYPRVLELLLIMRMWGVPAGAPAPA